MLKWFKTAGSDVCRIQKLEAEVADLRREQKILKDHNETMITCVENISKYERQLIEAIESLTQELLSAVNEKTNSKENKDER